MEKELKAKQPATVTPDLCRSEFMKLFEKAAYGKNYAETFRDFLDIFICCFSAGEYEQDYLNVIKNYKADAYNIYFPRMIAYLIEYCHCHIKDNIASDMLGDIYMEIAGRFKQSGLGQFFTPIHLCDLMSELVLDENANKIGYLGSDPTSGSGRLPIVSYMRNKHSFWLAADLDSICVKMTIINLYLHGMFYSEVSHMNSLSMEYYGGYRIELKAFDHTDGEIYLPVIRKVTKEQESKRFKGCSIYYERVSYYVESGMYRRDWEDQNGFTKTRELMEKFNAAITFVVNGGKTAAPVQVLPPAIDQPVQAEIKPPVQNNFTPADPVAPVVIEKTVASIAPAANTDQQVSIFEYTKTKKDKKLQDLGQVSLFDL